MSTNTMFTKILTFLPYRIFLPYTKVAALSPSLSLNTQYDLKAQ